MEFLGTITDPKDLTSKEYVDLSALVKSVAAPLAVDGAGNLTVTPATFNAAGTMSANDFNKLSYLPDAMQPNGAAFVANLNNITKAGIYSAGTGATNGPGGFPYSGNWSVLHLAAVNGNPAYRQIGWPLDMVIDVQAERRRDNLGNWSAWVYYDRRRSNVEAYHSANFLLAANANTTMTFNNETVDDLGEFNPATGIYTANHACKLIVTGMVMVIAPSATTNRLFTLLANAAGAEIIRLDDQTTPATAGDLINTFAQKIQFGSAGGQFKIIFHLQTASHASQTIRGGSAFHYLRVHEVA